ncbi:MAG: hypothetical protein JNL71_16030 [Rhodospirillales bacterium]|nr:hypothetical protein [Rhodospirillales bacterium]
MPRIREVLLGLASAAIATGLLLGSVEMILRFLPVRSAMLALPVDAATPIFRLSPGREFDYSRGWDFDMANRGRVNNAGFVSDVEYDRVDRRPLVAVVGDSFVEALMVPYAETLQARLAAIVGPARRVYSFAASGAPFSQYLVWAEHAVRDYGADGLVVVVVGNDYAESVVAHGIKPGFHQYARGYDGRLTLQRNDYQPSAMRAIAARSALFRYVWLNLQLPDAVAAIRRLVSPPVQYAGFESAAVSPVIETDSLEAIEVFLADLATRTGLVPGRIAFLVDGFRYPEAAAGAGDSYFARLRTAFIARARAAGFTAVDMDETFFPLHARDGRRFEFPKDGHWSGIGHEAAAKALMESGFLERLRGID